MLRLRTGNNATFGGFAALSLETEQTLEDNFQISGGVQYNTVGRTAFEARPAYSIDYSWGSISAEALLSYRYLASVNSFAAGAGADVSGRWVGLKFGYYYHLYGQGLESWDLQIAITNNERFELERHYQPTFLAECSYELKDDFGLTMGIGCKPAGMFNLVADYYQSFLNLGVIYKW